MSLIHIIMKLPEQNTYQLFINLHTKHLTFQNTPIVFCKILYERMVMLYASRYYN